MPEEDDILKSYVRAAKKHGLLSSEEEASLIATIRRGERKGSTHQEKQAADQARQRFILCNLRLVIYTARAMENREVSTMCLTDMVQEGVLGIMKALETFEPERGFKFSTYATWRIRQTIAREAIRDRAIRVPEYLMHERFSVHQYQRLLRRKMGREPTVEEISDWSGLSEEKINIIFSIPAANVSIDSPSNNPGKEDLTLAEILPDTSAEDPEEQAYLEGVVMSALEPLAERDRDMIQRRYGLCPHEKPQSLQEIADAYGLSRERVRQVLNKVMVSVRETFQQA